MFKAVSTLDWKQGAQNRMLIVRRKCEVPDIQTTSLWRRIFEDFVTEIVDTRILMICITHQKQIPL
jgi:hypothetical protein